VPGSAIRAAFLKPRFRCRLARASDLGGALLPVFLPPTRHGYTAHILPEIPYERARLRDRSARQALTSTNHDLVRTRVRLYLNHGITFVPVCPGLNPS